MAYQSGSSTTTNTLSHTATITAGSGRIALVTVAGEGVTVDPDLSVTIGGQAMTKLGGGLSHLDGGSSSYLYVFFANDATLSAAADGVIGVSAVNSSGQGRTVAYAQFSGRSQSAPTFNSAVSTTNDTACSVSSTASGSDADIHAATILNGIRTPTWSGDLEAEITLAQPSGDASTGQAYGDGIAAGSVTAGITASGGTRWVSSIVVMEASGSSPAITDAGDELFENGESITITGTGFGASQGTGTVKLCPTDNVADGSAQAQTVTSWSDTSITITVSRGSLSFLTNLYLFVTADGGSSNASGYVVQIEPKVYLRETLVDLTESPLASVTGITAFIWHSAPASGNQTPTQALSDLSTDANGDTNYKLTRGSLVVNDPIWVMLLKDGSPHRMTARKITPAYE